MGRVWSKERWAHLIGALREELSRAMASSPPQQSHLSFWAVGFMALHRPVMHLQLAGACGLEGLSEDYVSSPDLGWFPLCFTVSVWIMCVCPSCPKGFSKRRFNRIQLCSVPLDWSTNLLSFLSFMCSISHPRVVLECASGICTRGNVNGYCCPVGSWVTGAQLKGVWRAPKISVLLLDGFAWQIWSCCLCCLLLHTAKSRPCSQETAVSSGTWPPCRSGFADGSSCSLLKPNSWVVLARALSALTWPSLPAALSSVNQPLSFPVWLFSMGCFLGCCAWKVS